MAAPVFRVRRLRESSSDVNEEYSIVHAEDEYKRYPTTKIPIHQIYKKTMFSRVNFLKGYKIKILENKLTLENKLKDVHLLSREAIRSHRSKYKFLHIGLVQVSISRLTLPAKPTETALIRLRNGKSPNFEDSVLVAFEYSVRQRALNFNWFPNYSSPLSDLGNSNALVLTIEPHIDQPEVVQTIQITYRMCYKLMKTSLKPQSLFNSPVLEVNTENTKVLVPKSINQNEKQ